VAESVAEDFTPHSREPREPRRDLAVKASSVPVMSRKDFLAMFGREYHPGQHVTFLGPSGRGKTRLCGEMLKAVLRHMRGRITVAVLHGKIKGRDNTISDLSKSANLPITEQSRPSLYSRKVRHRNANGFIVRPLTKPGNTSAEENSLLQKRFRGTIHKAYHAKMKKPVILVVDEAHQAHNDLKLKGDCEAPLMRGRPVCGVWSLIQRGRYVSYMVYDQAEWMIIFYDPTVDNQRRYSEIGGVDPQLLIELSRRLKTKTAPDGSTYSQAICFRRSGDMLFIVDT
jgi:energy-coupling factor transporter ATP-binding protein EcfA2